MNRSESFSVSSSGNQSDDGINVIEIKKEKRRTVNIDVKLYEKLITFINVNNNILMNIKNRKDVIKYSQQTQTEEEVIKEEAQKELKLKEKEIENLKKKS